MNTAYDFDPGRVIRLDIRHALVHISGSWEAAADPNRPR
jgi:hypothetical protein